MATQRAGKRRRRGGAGGRPAMSAANRRRVRAALRVLRARCASWEVLAQIVGVRTRTLARIMNTDAGASMETVALVAIQILPSMPMSNLSYARHLLEMSVSDIGALGDRSPRDMTETQPVALGAAEEGKES